MMRQSCYLFWSAEKFRKIKYRQQVKQGVGILNTNLSMMKVWLNMLSK